MRKIHILGVTISDTNEQEILEFIVRSLEKGDKKIKIFTPNPEIIMFAQRHKAFKKVLNSAEIALADGIGVLWAAKMLDMTVKKRITGVDFMELLSKEAAKQGFTVGFLGGGPKIAEKAAECLRRKYPGLKVAFVGRSPRLLSRKSPIDILFVAFGFPKQEQWIDENLPKIPVHVAMTVGGALDYISGEVPRAPKFLRDFGLEWLFRLLVQPRRWRRQLALLTFLLLVLKERTRTRTP